MGSHSAQDRACLLRESWTQYVATQQVPEPESEWAKSRGMTSKKLESRS